VKSNYLQIEVNNVQKKEEGGAKIGPWPKKVMKKTKKNGKKLNESNYLPLSVASFFGHEQFIFLGGVSVPIGQLKETSHVLVFIIPSCFAWSNSHRPLRVEQTDPVVRAPCTFLN
jgi:hypothetical protein